MTGYGYGKPSYIEGIIQQGAFLDVDLVGKWLVCLYYTFFLLAFMFASVLAMALRFVTLVIFEAVRTKGSIRATALSRCLLNFLNQKLTIVNSTKAAKTKAVHKPIHTSMA